jgi:hypothetical protein
MRTGLPPGALPFGLRDSDHLGPCPALSLNRPANRLMNSPSTVRVQLHRERRRRGLAMVGVAVTADVRALLIRRGYLRGCDTDDVRAVAHALDRMLQDDASAPR